VKIVFFPLLQTYSQKWDRNFLFFLIMHILSVPSFLSLLHLGRFCIEMWLRLQMHFPFPVSGKIFLYIILIFSTFESVVPIKCHAVVSYWNTNIYSLKPVTVMVILCVNPAANFCGSLCLLGCSPARAVDVVCDDARKPFWHVPPLARVCYMITVMWLCISTLLWLVTFLDPNILDSLLSIKLFSV